MTQPLFDADKVTASAVLELLAARHSDDLFVSECKDGPSQSRSHVRLDAWVMPRSWARPETTGYEIKVSRADFLSDDKWPSYLALCNRFYFVAPPGVIEPSELAGSGAGLLLVTKGARGLRVKCKASVRQIEQPLDLWRYVLMSRSRITPPNMNQTDVMTNAERWRDWLATKEENRRLGYEVSVAIRDHVASVEARNFTLEHEAKGLRETREILEEMGISRHTWRDSQAVRDAALQALAGQLPSGLTQTIRNAMRDLDRAHTALSKFEEENSG